MWDAELSPRFKAKADEAHAKPNDAIAPVMIVLFMIVFPSRCPQLARLLLVKRMARRRLPLQRLPARELMLADGTLRAGSQFTRH